MRKSTARAARSIPVILLIAAAVGWAGSQGGQRVGVIPVFALCGAFCFALNWLVFIHAYAAQTERYFDLTGSLTYLSFVACAVALGSRDPRALLLALLIGAWALRLGTFLFRRIRREGGDRRFDALEPSFPRFLLTWTHTRSASAEQPILLAIERIDSNATRAGARAPAPSAALAPEPRLEICSCVPSLHPREAWRLRECRGDSSRRSIRVILCRRTG
jgi:hypothetical protein